MPFTRDEITTLHTASEVYAVASAETKAAQIERTVAANINQAANMGQFETLYQHPLLDEIITKLKSNGFSVTARDTAFIGREYIISWRDA